MKHLFTVGALAIVYGIRVLFRGASREIVPVRFQQREVFLKTEMRVGSLVSSVDSGRAR